MSDQTISLDEEDLETPEYTRVSNPAKAYRWLATRDRGGGFSLELAMPRAEVEGFLSPDVALEEYRVSFLSAEKALKAGLVEQKHVIIAAKVDGKPSRKPRNRGKVTSSLRIGTFKWSSDELTTLKNGTLNNPVEPTKVNIAGAPALALPMPAYT